MGCALRLWLVVLGPESGNLWADYRADHKGPISVADENSDRVTFYEWHRAWLDEALEKI